MGAQQRRRKDEKVVEESLDVAGEGLEQPGLTGKLAGMPENFRAVVLRVLGLTRGSREQWRKCATRGSSSPKEQVIELWRRAEQKLGGKVTHVPGD